MNYIIDTAQVLYALLVLLYLARFNFLRLATESRRRTTAWTLTSAMLDLCPRRAARLGVNEHFSVLESLAGGLCLTRKLCVTPIAKNVITFIRTAIIMSSSLRAAAAAGSYHNLACGLPIGSLETPMYAGGSAAIHKCLLQLRLFRNSSAVVRAGDRTVSSRRQLCACSSRVGAETYIPSSARARVCHRSWSRASSRSFHETRRGENQRSYRSLQDLWTQTASTANKRRISKQQDAEWQVKYAIIGQLIVLCFSIETIRLSIANGECIKWMLFIYWLTNLVSTNTDEYSLSNHVHF